MNSNIRLALMLGYQDLRQAYRRSAIGPFWLTLGMAVQIASMGFVFGLIFKNEITEYLPFLAVSIIVWNFMTTTINEGCFAFIASEGIIKQIALPFSTFVVRVVWRNLLIAGHNAVIIPLVLLIFLLTPSWSLIALVPGAALLVANLGWIVWITAFISSRYRDTPQIISSVLTVAFFVTPIMWNPELMEDNALTHLFLGLNPFYHLLQIVRLPILGSWPTLENWGLAILSALAGSILVFLIDKKYKNRIAFWV